MIVFGTRMKIKGSKNGQNLHLACEYCQQQNTLKPMLQFSYVHVFGIPVFPYSKRYVTECSCCKNYKSRKELSQAGLGYVKQNTDLKILWAYYTGLLLILLPIVFSLVIGITATPKV